MRLRLKLQVDPVERVLPINYQYPIAAWIYRRLQAASPEFAAWLHERGYGRDGHRFKHFTFSRLHIPQRHVAGDRLMILGDEPCELQLGFAVDRAREHFLESLLGAGELELYDRTSKARFRILAAETAPPPEPRERVTIRTLSPLCVTRPRENAQADYLAPDDPEFSERLARNLLSKWESLRLEPPPEGPVQFRPLGRPKSRLIHVKADRDHPIRVRGFDVRLACEAPPALLALAWSAGLGEKCSLGFGCVEFDAG